MRWITALQLEQWSRSIASKTDLAELVGDLIRATAKDIDQMRFPSGDKGSVRGFDGHLVAQSPGLNVPAGVSIWEFGTDPDYKDKLRDDFNSRTKAVPAADQGDITLVLVTPWTWDSSDGKNKIEDWQASKKATSNWKAVRIIDGSILQTWLAECPAVASWHARCKLHLAPVNGARSIEEFWTEFAGQFERPITDEVLLCERQDAAGRLLASLMGPPSSSALLADSPDEVVAFAIAAIRQAPPAVKLYLEARTMVIDSPEAARYFAPKAGMIFLLRGEAGRSPSQFAESTTLVSLGAQQKTGRAEILPRPTAWAMGKAMQSMGWGENEALTLARGCGRSLTALARQRPGGMFDPPAWKSQGAALLPAILAGAWSRENELDKTALATIANPTPYRDLEIGLRAHLSTAEPPVETIGALWAVRAPMDAFMWAGDLIGPDEAERLRAALIEVFGAVEPEPDPDAPFVFSPPSVSGHTEELREGLATTLLMLAVWGEVAKVNLAPDTGQAFADRVVAELPGLTTDYRLLARLHRELPLLAEAAPVPLLSALERLLEGNGELIAPIFNEATDFTAPSSRHTGLLWALETLAWDPDYFRRAAMILARLDAIDPGGKLGNRPIASLHEIFILWNPNTNASLAQRMAVLDEITRTLPVVAWRLLVTLLPSLHASSSPTAKPRLREAGAADRKPVTNREYAEAQLAVIDRVLALVGDDETRWKSFIPTLAMAPPDRRQLALAALEVTLERVPADQREVLWTHLRNEVSRHAKFATAKWALPATELEPMQALVDRFVPTAPIYAVKWLFEEWDLDASVDRSAGIARRAAALGDYIKAAGSKGVVDLARVVNAPYLVVEAVDRLALSQAQLLDLLETSFIDDPETEFTFHIAGLYRRAAGEATAHAWLVDARKTGRLTQATLTRLLLSWPDGPPTWAVARRLGPGVEAGYWSQRSPRYLTGPRSDLLRSSLMLLRHGRAIAALRSSLDRLDEIPTKLLLRMIGETITQLNRGDTTEQGTMIAYYLEQGLKALDKRSDASLLDVVKLEYGLLPLLEHSSRPLRIYELMATVAGVYHNLICDVFREAGAPPREPDPATQSRARQSYSLLSNFDKLPGEAGGEVDANALNAWVADLRLRGEATDRVEITDSYLGRVLAHAPQDSDGAWPHRAVRDLIERLGSDRVENGIMIERFNMRGVFMKNFLDGGAQERELAKTNADAAQKAQAWPRTAEMLKNIAKRWEADARRADIDAEQRRRRT